MGASQLYLLPHPSVAKLVFKMQDNIFTFQFPLLNQKEKNPFLLQPSVLAEFGEQMT